MRMPNAFYGKYVPSLMKNDRNITELSISVRSTKNDEKGMKKNTNIKVYYSLLIFFFFLHKRSMKVLKIYPSMILKFFTFYLDLGLRQFALEIPNYTLFYRTFPVTVQPRFISEQIQVE